MMNDTLVAGEKIVLGCKQVPSEACDRTVTC